MLTFTRPGLIAVCYCSQTEIRSEIRPDGTYTPNSYASCKGDESRAADWHGGWGGLGSWRCFWKSFGLFRMHG